MSEVKRFEMEKEYSLDINIVPTEYPEGSFVHYDDYAAIQEQLAQRDAQIAELAAENLDLKQYVVDELKYLSPTTPATDAAANELRAEGGAKALEDFAQFNLKSIGINDEYEEQLREVARAARAFANQLREGK